MCGQLIHSDKSNMSAQSYSLEKSIEALPFGKTRATFELLPTWLVVLVGLSMIAAFFVPPQSPYALSHSFWYADFRYWHSWVSGCCWLIFVWTVISFAIRLFLPENTKSFFWYQQVFYQRLTSTLFIFFIWIVWYNYAALQ